MGSGHFFLTGIRALSLLICFLNSLICYAMYMKLCIGRIYQLCHLGHGPPLWALDWKCSKLKISHTAVIGLTAIRVAKQRRQRDSLAFYLSLRQWRSVVHFPQTILPPLLQVSRRPSSWMKSQQPHKNTIQLAVLATTATQSTFQNMFWNIDDADSDVGLAKEFNHVKHWADENRMVINILKTKEVVFRRPNNFNPDARLANRPFLIFDFRTFWR